MSPAPLANDEFSRIIAKLRHAVRSGDFRESETFHQVWDHREQFSSASRNRLLAHTLAWEIFDSRGEYVKASEYLREGKIVEDSMRLLFEATGAPDQFVAAEFPQGLTDEERRLRYDVWRQRTMGAMAWCFTAFRLQESGYEERFELIRLFIENCLGGAGFPCNGTRARCHFFVAQINEANHGISRAASEYQLALYYCIQRAVDRLRDGVAEEHQTTERAFAIYCLGKLKLKMSQLEFEEGRLRLAGDHVREASLLLRVSRDPFLPEAANLLNCLIERYEPDFMQNGSSLLERMQALCGKLEGHRPLFLEARLEEVITRVYLLKSPQMTQGERARELDSATLALDKIIENAREYRLPAVEFKARLAKARALSRRGNFKGAFAILKEPGVTARVGVSSTARAEARFVEGRIHAASAAAETPKNATIAKNAAAKALQSFQNARALKHPSIAFRIACAHHIASLLLDSNQVVEAEKILKETQNEMQGMDGTFLQVRQNGLLQRLNDTAYSIFTFKGPFNLDRAKEELDRKYLINLPRGVGAASLADLRSNWHLYRKKASPLTYNQLKHLLDKYPDLRQT